MFYLNLTCETAAEDLALDEALLDAAENGDSPFEILRIWELRRPAVVVGRSSQTAVEVQRAYCREHDVPVLRRTSGGAAIVAGPGCLMYSVVLSYVRRPDLRAVDAAHCFVLNRVLAAVKTAVPEARICGTSDLAVGDRKFSGNSLRCRREHFLYHGTLLYGFPLELISQCLGTPPRQPEYRGARPHASFVTNHAASREKLIAGLRAEFAAMGPPPAVPWERVRELVAEKYSQAAWIEGS